MLYLCCYSSYKEKIINGGNMYFYKFLFYYFISVVLGYLIPQVTSSKVEVSQLLNDNKEIITNTQFDVDCLGRLLLVFLLIVSWIFFLFKYKSKKDKEEITIKFFFLFQIYICFSGFLYGMNKKIDIFFIFEFLFGVLISLLLIGYSKINKQERKKSQNKLKLYPSREVSKRKLEYLLSEETASSILIDGDWGIGKTYFLDYVLLDKEDKFEIFKYDSLLFDSREKLIKLFLNDLKIMAKNNGFLIGDSSDYFSTLVPIASKLPFGLGEIFTKKLSVSDSRKEFEKFSNRLKRKVIVVIDNLERINEKNIFIQIIGILHELNNFKNIKIIVLMDSKKTKEFQISSSYINKFFINQIELKQIPIHDILDSIEELDKDIELGEIIYELERIKEKYLELGLKEKIERNVSNFQNPRIYEQGVKRFKLHIKSYKNLYISELDDIKYKNKMFLSSLIYFLIPNLETEILIKLISNGKENLTAKLMRRDYYDIGTDIGDEVEKIMQTDEIDIQLERYLEKIIYCYYYMPQYKSKVKEKYLKFLESLNKKKDIYFFLVRIEEKSKNNLFDLIYEALKLEKEYGISCESSIISLLNKMKNHSVKKKYMDNLIILYKNQIEEIQFYVNPIGKELTLKNLELNKEIVNNNELRDILDIYFLDIKNVDEHIEEVLTKITDINLKNNLEIFASKYKSLREA